MPSLLDMYMARQNPMAQSLLGQQEPQQPSPGGLLGGGGGGGGAPQPQQPQRPPSPMQARQMQLAQQQQEMARMAPLKSIMSQAGRAVTPNQRLDTRETLVNTGLALLAGNGEVSMGQALATGVMAGRQAAAHNNAARQQEAAAQQRANQYLQVLGDGPMTRGRLEQAIKVATINGDNDALRVFADLRKNLPDDTDLLERKNITLENGMTAFVNGNGELFNVNGDQMSVEDLEEISEAEKDLGWELRSFGDLQARVSKETGLARELGTGRLIGQDEMRQAVMRARPADTQLRTYMRPDGTEVEAVWNNRTNSFVPGTEMVVSYPSNGGGDNREIATLLRSNVANMREILGDDPKTEEFEGAGAFQKVFDPAFGRISRFVPGNWQPERAQSFSIYAQDALSLIIRARSGQQASDAEVERLQSVVLPQAGNPEETVRRKIEKLEEIINVYEQDGADAANNLLRAQVGLAPLPGTAAAAALVTPQQVISGLDAMGVTDES